MAKGHWDQGVSCATEKRTGSTEDPAFTIGCDLCYQWVPGDSRRPVGRGSGVPSYFPPPLFTTVKSALLTFDIGDCYMLISCVSG
jgi:hypothetical protein